MAAPPPPQPPDPPLDPRNATSNWNDIPQVISRSPHPYRRNKRLARARSPARSGTPYLPSPALTPLHSDSERARDRHGKENSLGDAHSHSESGTEADDESLAFTKALPAPPARPRKGLRGGEPFLVEDSSRQTPSLDTAQQTRAVTSYFGGAKTIPSPGKALQLPIANPKTPQSRHFERSRRVAEALSLLALFGLSIAGASESSLGSTWHAGLGLLLQSIGIVFGLSICQYALRLLFWRSSLVAPPSFDPAPILYPPLLPIMVAFSLSSACPAACLPNVILGISSIPSQIIPSPSRYHGISAVHWLLSLSPLLLARLEGVPLGPFGTGWVAGQSQRPALVNEELLTLLFPLHQCLLLPLRYLTTSSLLPAELQLLSVALLNVLLLAESPPMLVWKYLVWVGGFGTLALCTQVLKWNVALERIPSWRFRRAAHVVQASRSFLSTLADGIHGDGQDAVAALSGSEDEHETKKPSSPAESLLAPPLANGSGKSSAPPHHRSTRGTSTRQRRRTMSTSMHAYLSMTPTQAVTRKVVYTAWTYLVMFSLVLGPIRAMIGAGALQGSEPFGWAVSYLFGDVDRVRSDVLQYNLESWIPLSPNPLSETVSPWIDGLRYGEVGPGNARLLIFAYFAGVLAMGIGLVLIFSQSVEVDTRRKIFHGTMVALFLPTAYIDPQFLSLGLVLVLAVFLALEVIRAGQMRPLSKPLARFLAPYVDGRDLRGPVVVSHMFLLIGCAIPLWLSLAGTQQQDAQRPWRGWEVGSRDTSMLAGVVCVGMGDAAASLVGRRVGRHKWPWRGGKSLEGSAAFAVAVAMGLVLSKLWLRAGQWRQSWEDDEMWTTLAAKALTAGMVSSFTEATLTGCNDNVVVPVILWLVVRGLRI